MLKEILQSVITEGMLPYTGEFWDNVDQVADTRGRDRNDLRVLYTVDATLSEVPASGPQIGWCHEFLTPQQFAFLRDRPQLHCMWGFCWQTEGAQPADTVSVIAHEYVRTRYTLTRSLMTDPVLSLQLSMLLRWHFHGVRGLGRLRISTLAWEDFRDLVLTERASKMIKMFDSFHFVVLTDYTIDLR